MKKLAAILPALLIASVMAGCADSSAANKEVKEEEAAVKSIELNEENFKQLGRTYYNNGKIYCALSGSGAEFTFTGTEVTVTIEGDTNSSNPASADNQARVAVYVNGERKADEMIDKKTKTINVKISDTEQQNDVKIVKLSESPMSTYAISDITINGKDEKPAENKSRYIEFIGDSITCGYGVDDEDKDHHFSTKTEDCTKAYAYKTAEKLDADYSLVSFSGHGIISGYSGDGKKVLTQLVPPYYTHLGLTPQSINAFGGFKVQGKNEAAARKLIDDAKAVEEAGAFALVLECVPAKLAKIISEQLTIPTIGIGAGAGCDGQILVYQDMLGMFSDYTPKFVKRFAEVGSVMKEAFANYIKEVQAETYPAEEHTFKIDDEVLEKLY